MLQDYCLELDNQLLQWTALHNEQLDDSERALEWPLWCCITNMDNWLVEDILSMDAEIFLATANDRFRAPLILENYAYSQNELILGL